MSGGVTPVKKIGYHINREKQASQPGNVVNHKLLTEIRNIVFKDTTESISLHYDYAKSQNSSKEKLTVYPFQDFKDKESVVIWGVNALEGCFDIKKFINFFFDLMKFVVWYDHDLVNIVGELIVCTEELTSPIMKEIKSSGVLSRGLFRALVNFQRQCLISDKYFEKIRNAFGGWAFFQLTTRNDLKISCSRKFVVDEYIGFVNHYMSNALVIYCLEYLDKSFISSENFFDVYRSILFSLDYYLNDKSEQVIKRLNNLIFDSVDFLNNPQMYISKSKKRNISS